MPLLQAPFDPSRDFIAKRSFRAGGKIALKGKPFDKSTVDQRVLRLLYEDRSVDYDTKKKVGVVVPISPAAAMAGHVRNFVDAVVAHVRAVPASDDPIAKHEQQIAEDTKEASGTAREAPGAEESTSAQSGSANASDQQEGGGSPESPPSTDETTPPAVVGEAPGEDEVAAATDGASSATVATVDEEPDQASKERFEELMRDHSQAQLAEMADGLDGITAKTPKAKIAAALVERERASGAA